MDSGYIIHTLGVDNARAYLAHRVAHPHERRMVPATSSPGSVAREAVDINTLDFRVDIRRGAVIPASVYQVPPCRARTSGGSCLCHKIRPTMWFFREKKEIRNINIGYSIAEIMTRHSQGKGPTPEPCVLDLKKECQLEYNWPFYDPPVINATINISGSTRTVTDWSFLEAVASHLDGFLKSCIKNKKLENRTHWEIGQMTGRADVMITRDTVLIIGLLHLGGMKWRPILQLDGITIPHHGYPRSTPQVGPPIS